MNVRFYDGGKLNVVCKADNVPTIGERIVFAEHPEDTYVVKYITYFVSGDGQLENEIDAFVKLWNGED